MGDVMTLSNSMPTGLLIGGRDKNEGPQIYSVSSPGIFGPVDNYDTIGSGGFYAGTILKNEFFKDMHSDHGHFLATRAVLLASIMDPYVGEGVGLATIFRQPNGYRDISHTVETRYRPLVERVNKLRHDLDLILMGEAFEQEDSLARLLDTLGVFGLGADKLSMLSQKAYELRQQDASRMVEILNNQEPRGQE